jgi:hypothetical protein
MSSSTYCNTCFKAGKSQKEYTSHNTKEKRGHNVVVVCPVILQTECRACHKMGHWASPKFCPLLKQRERQNKYQTNKYQTNNHSELNNKPSNTVKEVKKARNTNMFAALNDSDELEREEELVVPIVKQKPFVTPIKGFSYASMATVSTDEVYTPTIYSNSDSANLLVKPRVLDLTPAHKRNWADACDSDDEDELDYSAFDSRSDDGDWRVC